MTAIFCEQKLATVHLMHVDRYANHFKVSFGTTRRRADLFGRTRRGWVVAEAKGRSGGIESDLEGKMVAQKRSVSDINGSQPWVALACVAHFPRQGRYLQVSAVDPDEDDIETISMRVSMDSLMLAYYSPFVRAIEIGDAEDDKFTDMASFGGLGLHVGLRHNLRERIRRAESGELEGLHEDVLRILDDTPGTALQRTDGTTVITDWNEVMSLDDREAFFDTDYP
ncbi:hypothetical protein [Saccharothrix sp. S26]|uniref:hypothetical protein n=1 Tax=Saccharothrix sp. S26 TaxID=2907215 RepID=UPI001F234207|nr:hypothetical protein [Saccharothrix sp. S26]